MSTANSAFCVKLVAAIICVVSLPAYAATSFPEKPITIVVPYTAGGSSDVVARLLEKPLSEKMGQPVIILNRAGAGATIGTNYVAKAPADGYTVLLADNAQTTAPSMYSNLQYDAIDDFQPIGMIGSAPAILLSSEQSKLHGIQDLLRGKEKNSEGFTAGVGAGSPSYLITGLFQVRSGIKLQMIPYKGASQAATDLLGSQIELLFTNPASAASYLKSGRINAIGIAGTGRYPTLPNVPTFKEQGIDGLDNTNYWFALLAPAQLPEDIAQKWKSAFTSALALPEVIKKLAELGISKSEIPPNQVAKFIADDRQNWAHIVKEAGMKLQ